VIDGENGGDDSVDPSCRVVRRWKPRCEWGLREKW